MVELVIKIPEETYKQVHNCTGNTTNLLLSLSASVLVGTLLPKGHGRLIDADALLKDINDYSDGVFAMRPDFLIKNAPTIIEADKENEECTQTV